MKATRAYIAGLGASSALLAAVIVASVLVGSLLAFNGLPGNPFGGGQERVKVGKRAASPAGTASGVRPSAERRAAGRLKTAPGKAAGPSAGARGSGKSPAGRGGSGAPPAGTGKAPADGSGGGAAAGSRGQPSPGGGDATRGLADALHRTGGSVGETLGGTAPPVSAPGTPAVTVPEVPGPAPDPGSATRDGAGTITDAVQKLAP